MLDFFKFSGRLAVAGIMLAALIISAAAIAMLAAFILFTVIGIGPMPVQLYYNIGIWTSLILIGWDFLHWWHPGCSN